MTDDTTDTEQSRVAADCQNERLVMCDECRDTGAKVIFNDRFAEGYAIVFCDCVNGRILAATQADVLNEHGA